MRKYVGANTCVLHFPDHFNPPPPKYSRDKPPRGPKPRIGTMLTSQFPRSSREAHWGAVTVPSNYWALPFMSSHPLYRIPPRVEVPFDPTYMQQSFAYFHLKGAYCEPRGARTTT